ncbi:hypothetical protein M422DRAFT_124972, partial [Sphaerobolus stellatus SS14]
GTKTQHLQGNANRENVTALVTICADGTVLKPTIIFKGKRMQAGWRANNEIGASFACSPNGWTDGELALKWMIDDFDAQTREKASGRIRVLFLDGHSSHYMPELLWYSLRNGITILGYPPHCMHALQGLDVVCFAIMKLHWTYKVNAFEGTNSYSINKDDFVGVFGKAFIKAFTPKTIKSAFRATGICPYNPNIVTVTQMRPSETTSTQASSIFPLDQPSPVKALLAVWPSPQRHARLPITPVTPVAHQRDPNIDPALYSQTETAQQMRQALAETSYGLHLV